MFHLPLYLLLTITPLVPFSFAVNKHRHSWSGNNVPLLVDRNTVQLPSPTFSDGESVELDAVCGIECQRNLPEPGTTELERLLAYETFYENGTRTLTEVELQDVRNSSSLAILSRSKREVYGTDERFVMADKHFVTNFPFSASVKLSMGCSGILVSPKHVLTAAHCVHDGRGYRRRLKRLRVGVMKLQRNTGRRRNKMEGESKRKQNKRKGKKRKNPSKQKSFENSKQEFPRLRWTRVKQTYIPQGWISDVGKEVTLAYDYALLELKSSLLMKHMDLGVVPHVTRIHFSSFDDDHTGKLVYRFCSVTQESGDLMYQHCDAQKGSNGAGVYVRLHKTPTEAKGKWRRKVIGVFSGHKSVKEGNGAHMDYNVAVRITPSKLAQICLWIHGVAEQCASN